MTEFSKFKDWVSEASKEIRKEYVAKFYAFDVNITLYEETEDGTVGHVEHCYRGRASDIKSKYFYKIIESGKAEGYQGVSIELCPETRDSFDEDWDSADFERPDYEIVTNPKKPNQT